MKKPPDSIASIADLRAKAHKRVPFPFMDYVENGAFAELTLERNRRDLDAIELRQRVMCDVSKRKLEIGFGLCLMFVALRFVASLVLE